MLGYLNIGGEGEEKVKKRKMGKCAGMLPGKRILHKFNTDAANIYPKCSLLIYHNQ